MQTPLLGPFSYAALFPTNRQDSVVARVAGLFFGGKPSAVLGLVVSIRVDPVKSKSLRARPHVCQEISEQTPPFAHRDTTSPVARVSNVVGVGASLDHAPPSVVLRGGSSAPCGTVSGRPLCGTDRTQAPARFGVTIDQVFDRHVSLCPAVATDVSTIPRHQDHGEVNEPLPYNFHRAIVLHTRETVKQEVRPSCPSC